MTSKIFVVTTPKALVGQVRHVAGQARPTGTLVDLVKEARRLERNGPKPDLAAAYEELCDFLARGNQLVEAAPHAVKWLAIETDAEKKCKPIHMLAGALASLEKGADKEEQLRARLTTLKDQLASHLERISDPAALTLGEKLAWLTVLNVHFPARFLPLQLSLCRDVFLENPDPRTRCAVAEEFLLAARRAAEFELLPEAERARTREIAEFLLDPRHADVVRMENWTNESFYTVIINLSFFELFDLQASALERRNPPREDPIWRYVQLLQQFRVSVPYAFVAACNSREANYEPSSPVLARELSLLRVKIARAHLEANKKSVLDIELSTEQLTVEEYILASPRAEQPGIMRAIDRMRSSVFRSAAASFRDRVYMCRHIDLPPLPEGIGKLPEEAFIIVSPQSPGLEIYLFYKDDGRAIKICHVFQDATVKKRSVQANASHDGVAAGRQGEVALFWEYYATLALARAFADECDKAGLQASLDAVTEAISNAEHELRLEVNRRVFENLAAAFAGDSSFFANRIDLDSRLAVSRKMLAWGYDAAPSSYVLEEKDLLASIVKSVSIRDERWKAARDGEKRTGPPPTVMTLETADGGELTFLLNGLESLTVPGVPDDSNTLLCRYLLELALLALVKVKYGRGFEEDTPKDGDVTTGYLIGESGLGALKGLYRRAVNDRLKSQGLLKADDWFVRRDDGLFVPLEDQSLAAKRAALDEGRRAGDLFLPLEPLGIPRRLPVRRKRVDGVLTVAPWERNPLRVKQQELLGDTRPLPTYYGIYIVTTLSDGRRPPFQHLRLYALGAAEKEIMDSGVLEAVVWELAENKFRDPEYLFKGTKKATREMLTDKLRRGELTIVDQRWEPFYPIQTIISRPVMASIASLLAKSYVLELS
jgi:hypothetical protein